MKLGDYKGRKVTENGSDDFLVFGLKLVLNMTFNLSETYFSEKFAILRYLHHLFPLILHIMTGGHDF